MVSALVVMAASILWDCRGASATEPTNAPSVLSEWVVRSWQTEHGLPQNTVNAILQTRDGFLWVGTSGGLARFDGVRFRHFGLQDGLRSIYIFRLAEDRDGRLWVGTVGGGVSRWDNGRFTSFGSAEGFTEGTVQAILPDRDGSLWIGTEKGLTKWNQGVFTQIGPAEGLPRESIRALAQDADGALWVSGMSNGLFRGTNGHFAPVEKTATTPQTVYSLLATRDGAMWAGFGNGLMWRWQQGKWEAFNTTNGLPAQSFESLAQSPDGSVLFTAQKKGLYRFNGKAFSQVLESREFADGSANSLIIDREGSIWVGTAFNGLYRLSRRVLNYWIPPGGGQIVTLVEDRAGLVWTASGSTIYQLKEGRLAPFTNTASLIYCGESTSDGTVWMAGEQALFRFTPGKSMESVTNGPIRGQAIRALCADGEKLWMGTYYSALLKWETNGLSVMATNGSFPSTVRSLTHESEDTLWVGCASGLYQWSRGQVRKWPVPGEPLDLNVRALYRDGDGTLWIGTAGHGLARLKDGHIAMVTSRQGLIDDVISQILADDSGHLWLGCNRGIMRLERDALNAVLDAKVSEVYPVVFDRNEGMLKAQSTGGRSPTALKTKDGRLFFPTVGGLAEIDPRRLKEFAKLAPPEATIDTIAIDGQPQLPGAEIVVPPGKHRFEVTYTAPNLRNAEWLRFRYRLDGLDRHWVNAGTRRTVAYEALHPGRYTLHISVHGGDGNWNEAGASVAFVIQPFFWQTAWFRIGTILLVAAASAGAVRGFGILRRRRAREELERLRQSEERWRSVVEGAPNAMVVANEKGKITLVNARAEGVFGYTREELLGNSVDVLIPEALRPRFAELRQLYVAEPSANSLEAGRKILGRRKDGTQVPLEIGLNAIQTPEGQFVLASLIDITERLAAETRLRESEQRMSLAADAAHLGMWVWNVPDTYMWVSEKWRVIHGYGLDEDIRYDALVERIHREDRAAAEQAIADAINTRGAFHFELRIVLPNGMVRWLSKSGRVEELPNSGGVRVLGIAIDITERKQIEEAALEVSGKLITAQEDERKRIARDLHDDLNQRLALLSVETDLLGRMENNAPAQALIKDIALRVRELSAEVHKLSYQLHPAKLDQLGLVSATRAFCQELQKQCGVAVEFSHDSIPRDLDRDVALCLYRIVQESLQNMVKHSRATQAQVHLKREAGALWLVVHDNGRGFDTELADHHAGLGLVGMRERVRLVHGHITIHSATGQGTRVEVTVPVAPTQTPC